MSFISIIAINAALQITSYLLDEYVNVDDSLMSDADSPPTKQRGSTTLASDGEVLPLVIGRARVRKTNVLLYQSGDKTFLEYLKGSYQDPGNEHTPLYTVDVHIGVCARPVGDVLVEFNTMFVGDEEVFPRGLKADWNGPLALSNDNGKYAKHNTRYQIRHEDLWGGPNKGGGIGNYDIGNGQHFGGGLWVFYGDLDQTEYAGQGGSGYTSTSPNFPAMNGMVVQGASDNQLTTGSHYGGTPGICTFALRDFQTGESPGMPGFSWEMTVCPDYSALAPQSITSTVDNIFGVDANPMAALFMVLTDDIVGLGMDVDDIDVGSLNLAANRLNIEKNGFSYASSKKVTAKQLIEMILKQVDGILYMDPVSLKLKITLARSDYGAYPYAALDEFDDSSVESVPSYKESSQDDVYNQVRVKFQSRSLAYADRHAVAQNSAAATSTGRIRSVDVEYPGVKSGVLANEIASRELAFYSTPQLLVTLEVLRTGQSLRPGDVIKWTSPDHNITGFMVLRIHRISYGTLASGTIFLECSRDKYANQTTTFANPPGSRWEQKTRAQPPAPGCQVVQEVPDNPYFNNGSNWESPATGGLLVLAAPYTPTGVGPVASPEAGPTGGTNVSTGVLTDAQGQYVSAEGGSNDSTECGQVSLAYSTVPGPYYDTATGLELVVGNPAVLRNSTESEVRQGRALILVGDEYMSYESYTDLSVKAAFRDSSSAVTAINQTSVVVPVPAGVVDGDLMIAIINLGPVALLTAPAGWAHVSGSPRQQAGTTDNHIAVMTKLASTEPANYTWVRSSAHLRKITGVISAFSDAQLDFAAIGGATVTAPGDTIPAGTTPFYVGGGASDDVQYLLTAVALDQSWDNVGVSNIEATENFIELHDLMEADVGQLHVQYAGGPESLPGFIPVGGPVDFEINLLQDSSNGTYQYVTIGIKSALASSNTYRLNNVWRGLFDTERGVHEVADTVFFFAADNIAKKITRKSFSCENSALVVFTESREPGDFTGSPKKQFNGLTFTKRGQRPTRPTAFTLRNDGADAEAAGPEIDYAYDVRDHNKVINSSTVGADSKVSSLGAYGDVWSNDLRGTWNRRPRVTDCSAAIVRGDDQDVAFGFNEDVSLRVDVKGSQEGDWSTIAQANVKGAPMRDSTDFIDMSKSSSGPGLVRLCAVGHAVDTGEELLSKTAESLTVDVHTSRQLLLNRSFVPFWDVDSDSSASFGDGSSYPGNPVYQARGWRDVTSGGGRPRFRVMSAPLVQGSAGEGFAFTGEFVDSEYVTIEQIVATPYLDTEGSTASLSWWFMPVREWDAFTVTMSALDANGDVVTTATTTQIPLTTDGAWSKFTLDTLAIGASVRSIKVSIGMVTQLTSTGPAISKVSLVLGPDVAVNQLLDSDFGALTNWLTTGAAFTLETSDGALLPVSSSHPNFARGGATDGELYQVVSVPPEFGTGDYVRLQWWTANTGSPGFGYMVLSARDSGGGSLEQVTVGGATHPNEDQWYFHEAYIKLPGEVVDVRVACTYKDDGGGGTDFCFDQPDLTFIKGGHS